MSKAANFQRDRLFDVGNLVAVVTGASSGIGLLMARALEANGATVYIIGRRKVRLENVAKEAVYGKLIPIQGDITSKDDLHRITTTITSNTGFINVLLANAGIPEPNPPSFPPSTSITETQDQLWKTWDPTAFTNTLGVNVGGTFLSVLAFLPLLAAGNEAANVPQRSQLITTSSICGFNRRAPSGFAYAASKAAVTHMTKQLATALAPHGIRCNVLAPGVFPSEMLEEEKFGGQIDRAEIPEERIGDGEDIAGAVLFMASRAGGYCNGNVLVLDGGRLSLTPSSY